MRALTSLIVVFIYFGAYDFYAQGEWKLTEEKNGIKVYRRPVVNSKFDELKVSCRIAGSLSQLVAVLRDYPSHPDWVYGTRTANRITSVSETEEYFYTEVNTPWPFQNRDVVVHLQLSQDPITRVVVIHANSEPDYLPEKEDLVRVPFSSVTWTLTPLPGNNVDVDYRIHVDPGGSIPAWVVNGFSSKAPYESFAKLREVVKLPKYEAPDGSVKD
jgi:hypothetical protein